MIIFFIVGIIIATAFNTYRVYSVEKIKSINVELTKAIEQRNFYQNAMNEILCEKQKLFNEFIECKAKANMFDDMYKH